MSEDEPVRPAALVSLAVTVWAPCARPVGVNDQTPVALAVVLPRTVEPSVERHRGVGVGGAGQRIVGGDVVGAGRMRQRFGHGRRHGVVGEGQRR